MKKEVIGLETDGQKSVENGKRLLLRDCGNVLSRFFLFLLYFAMQSRIGRRRGNIQYPFLLVRFSRESYLHTVADSVARGGVDNAPQGVFVQDCFCLRVVQPSFFRDGKIRRCARTFKQIVVAGFRRFC